jgi:hypothetical protein
MNDNLDQLAAEVAGYRKLVTEQDWHPRFSTSADAVLPLLEQANQWSCVNKLTIGYWGYTVSVCLKVPCSFRGEAPTFPRAACIALVRAKRAMKT